jgi:hypothetical protein
MPGLGLSGILKAPTYDGLSRPVLSRTLSAHPGQDGLPDEDEEIQPDDQMDSNCPPTPHEPLSISWPENFPFPETSEVADTADAPAPTRPSSPTREDSDQGPLPTLAYRRCRPSSPRRSEVLLLARSAPSSMTTPSFSGPSGPPLRTLASPAESHLLPYNRRRQSEALLPPSSEHARQSLWRLHRLQLHLLRLQRGRQHTLPAKSVAACDRARICVSIKVSSTSAPTGATS